MLGSDFRPFRYDCKQMMEYSHWSTAPGSRQFRMRQFYDTYRVEEKVAPLARQFSWSHNLIIFLLRSRTALGCSLKRLGVIYVDIRIIGFNRHGEFRLSAEADCLLYLYSP